MVNIQQWLNEKYSNKEKTKWIARQISRGFDRIGNRREIDNSYEDELSGNLIIKDFPNLEQIHLDLDDEEFYNYEGKLINLEVVNCPKLTELWCQYNQLIKLTIINCPKITKIACADNQLTRLDLSDLTELKILNCGKNKLVELDLRNNNELEDLVCHKNKLTSIQLPNNPEELTRLFLNKNNFSTQTLDFLKNCTNLTVLRLDNNDEIGLIENKEEEIDEEIYNRFYGSLEPLKNMFWLSHLDISDTDINTGLEYLPTENLKQFLCYVKNRPQSKVIEIARFCDGGAIIDKINKEIFIQNQFALMKEKGMELKEEKKEIKTVYKSSQQWLKDLNLQDDAAKFVDAQEWLDQNYPKKDRKNITELNINPYRNFFSEEKKLIGSLRLEDFINLKELNCGGNLITNLDLSDCRSLETLDCYSNKLSNLELKNLFRINRIDCSFNQINKLSIFNCPKISSLSAHNNILTNLDFLNTVNPKKIIYLNINDNNFPEQDLSVFSKFVNLKDLLIGNDKEGKNQQENINRFYGSLKFLRNIDKLELLDISNTNIDSGLEYLPDSLEKVFCKASGRSSSNEIHTFLKPFGTWFIKPSNFLERLINNYDYYDYQEWRKVNSEKVKIVQLEKELEVMKNQLSNFQILEKSIQVPPK